MRSRSTPRERKNSIFFQKWRPRIDGRGGKAGRHKILFAESAQLAWAVFEFLTRLAFIFPCFLIEQRKSRLV